MSTPAKQKRLPNYAYLNDESAQRYARSTLKGNYDLIPTEHFWRDRQEFLHKHGYVLRPRYWPNWKPSWLGTNLHPIYCEDSIVLVDYQVMDAKRAGSNDLVAIKKFRKDSQELSIAQFLSTHRDPLNHSVPILQILDDPHDSGLLLMVMPYLRPCNDPEFGTVGDVVEFINQTLEGLVFMHKNRIAHRDIAVENIMMDATPLYPDGHHPVRLDHSPDAVYPVTALPRSEHKIHYYYIDFGLSHHFPPGASPFVMGDVGRDSEVPELSSHVPYDAFKVDIYAIGNLYATEFEEKYNGMQFLVPLIEHTTQRDPGLRPTAEEVLAQWYDIRRSVTKTMARWRLGPKSEYAIGRMVNDTVAVALGGISHIKKYVS
ncbi:kinase-like domain-containing protein [Trametes maxima]|nr:kinase-like domain-containing protein [Trametes maxima]